MIFDAIFIILITLILLLVVKAAYYKAEKPSVELTETETVDSERFRRNLTEAGQIKTEATPDEKPDLREFAHFHAFLENEYPLFHMALKKERIEQASLIYVWEGSSPALEPIALTARIDGSKNRIVCIAEAVETLLREGFSPEKTVYLCFGDSDSGAKAIAETLIARGIRFEAALDGGSGINRLEIKHIISENVAKIGVAQKGFAEFKITAAESGNHALLPEAQTAEGMLNKLVLQIKKRKFKAKMHPCVFSFLDSIGRYSSFPAKLVMCNLKALPVSLVERFPKTEPLIRTTASCSSVETAPASDGAPLTASVTVRFSLLPGDSINDVKRYLKKLVSDINAETEFIKGREPSAVSSTETNAFRTLTELTYRLDEKAIAAPYIVTDTDDESGYDSVCKNIYRFSPSPNEEGVAFFKKYIKKMCKTYDF